MNGFSHEKSIKLLKESLVRSKDPSQRAVIMRMLADHQRSLQAYKAVRAEERPKPEVTARNPAT